MQIERSAAPPLGNTPLLQDYLSGAPAALSLFDYHPFDPAAFAARRDQLQNWPGDRALLAGTLEGFNRHLGADTVALSNARLLGEAGTLAVVTGQQAGIFAGPAFSVYKAITALALARRESERLGVPVVPVFWIAAEDHDFAEISAAEVPAGEGTQRLQIQSVPAKRASVGNLPLSLEVPALIDQLEQLLPTTEFRPEVMAALRSAATGTYADWFGRLMAWMFAGTGLVFLSPLLPGIRRLQAECLAHAIAQAPRVDAALAQGYARLAPHGYEPTLIQMPGSLHLYTYFCGERLPLHYEGDRAWVRDHPELHWSRSELTALAQAEPERFSTNVVLRPVSQGFALPDLAYVGGPGEIAYFSLLKDVFAACGRGMPIIYPRLAATLVEPPLARNLEKNALTVAEVAAGLGARRQALLEEHDAIGIPTVFDQYRQGLQERYSDLARSLAPLGPNVQQQADEHWRQMLGHIGKLQDKAAQQHRRNCEVQLKQLERLQAQLAPHGKLQDRSLSIVPFLAKYGPDLVRRLTAALALPEPCEHQIVYLGD